VSEWFGWWSDEQVFALCITFYIGEGSKTIWATRTAPINGCEMDMKWFLNNHWMNQGKKHY